MLWKRKKSFNPTLKDVSVFLNDENGTRVNVRRVSLDAGIIYSYDARIITITGAHKKVIATTDMVKYILIEDVGD